MSDVVAVRTDAGLISYAWQKAGPIWDQFEELLYEVHEMNYVQDKSTKPYDINLVAYRNEKGALVPTLSPEALLYLAIFITDYWTFLPELFLRLTNFLLSNLSLSRWEDNPEVILIFWCKNHDLWDTFLMLDEAIEAAKEDFLW